MQELQAAQLPLVLQLPKGPVQEALSVPQHRPELIREALSHLERRKRRAAHVTMELLSLCSPGPPGPPTAPWAHLSPSISHVALKSPL